MTPPDLDGPAGVEADEETERLAMFPLGSVLLPGMALPLRVFEPRYRVMMRELAASEVPELGVVLIERGSEVGGGETRSDVGCRAVVARATEHPDGTWSVLAVGTRRMRVRRWLPDDPYPVAEVADWPDVVDPDDTDEALGDRIEQLSAQSRRVAALAVELGARGELPDVELSDDHALRVYQLATLSPLGALDRRRILASPGLVARTELLGELLAEQELLLGARLSFDD
ncbi:MAG: LON peptidase substrate-binding domain-containing protein [Microthrixaceae bacterium]